MVHQRPSATPRPTARRATRRQVAATGMAALGALALGGASGTGRRALAQALDPVTGSGGAGGWVEPPVVLSADGVLDVTLDARPVPEAGLGRMGYAGRIPGPTLRFRPGDTVRVLLRNNLGGDQTNLHVHGLHVSPQGNGDNVFVTLDDGQSFQYAYAIPPNHPGGTFWYHPHHHGDSQEQVNAGLAGAIVIDGAIDAVPGVAGLPERLFVLQGPETRDGAAVYTVNGVANPEVAIRPGQTQRWRLANASANAYFDLQLDGHQFHVIANDGNALPETRSVDTLLLAPGQRADALVQATEPGRFQLRSLAWGAGGQAQPEFPVAALVAGGAAMEPQPLPTTLLPVEDLAAADIVEQRIINFQMNMTAPVFTIDGAAFDHHVVNTTVKLNTVEEWILRNTSDEWHPFHIHVNDFQVMSVNGEPRSLLWRDTVNLPPHGQVVVRIPFRDFAGKFVYHCHILAHEDFGMMAVVEVVP